ncbi:MAG: succinic semialdehyde dehydrogenase [Gemmatimonadota bacterium]
MDPDLLTRLAARAASVAHGSGLSVAVPFTGETLGTVPRAEGRDVAEAGERARRAQEVWAELPIAHRVRPLLRFHDLLLARQEEVLDLIQLESGKARGHAFEEVADVALVCRYYAYHAARLLRDRRRKGAFPGLTLTRETRRPVGVVGIISPWNYPLSLSVSDAAPALVAGNAVLLKPDTQGVFTALWAAALLEEAGLPPGLLQILPGEGPELGPPLIAAVDFLAFTGSTATGRAVGARAAERLIGCSLELGGKNPMIVFADARLQRAVAGALRGCFSSAGQLCLSIERLYVQDAIHDAFLERFLDRVRSLRMGAALDYTADVGSLVSAAQLRKVEAHVSDALAKGATLLAGGRPRPDLGPYFYEPTVLSGVSEGMLVHSEETFGPVVSVYPFSSTEEAVELANRSSYGLNASVWSSDLRFARAVAARLRAGTVNVNDAYAAAWASVDAPMGGVGDSGVGRRHGAEGIRKYTEAQTISVQRLVTPGALGGRDRSATWLTRLLRGLRHLPGLR